ncbi:MAG: hypothetical protein ACI835_006021 [Planctomycetota bacterium]|jgi:hypothetical protein
MPRISLAFLMSVSLTNAVAAQAAVVVEPSLRSSFHTIDNPSGQAQAHFGGSTVILDYDADGVPDLAVGAPGEDADRGAVYVYLGPDLATFIRLESLDRAAGDLFGSFLNTAHLDAHPGDDLMIGAERKQESGMPAAGAMYLVSHAGTTIKLSAPVHQLNAYFGCSAQSGDFTLDGEMELAIGARSASAAGGGPGAGVLYFFKQNSPGVWTYQFELACPDQVPGAGQSEFAGFGAHTAVLEDAAGNTMGIFATRIGAVVAPEPGRGAVDFIRVPMGPGATPMQTFLNPIASEDQDGNYRWGMHLAVQSIGSTGFDVSIGHNRQDRLRSDGTYAQTAGSATHFRVVLNTVVSVATKGTADDGIEFVQADHYGFRTQWVDLVGGPERELVNLALGTAPITKPRIYIYASGNLTGAPFVVPLPDGASHHAGNGMSSGQLFTASRKKELVLGDPFFGTGASNIGRVLIFEAR